MSGSIQKRNRIVGEAPPSRRETRLQRSTGEGIDDWIAVEEPLEIRVQGVPYAVTLRTPGDDAELALGFLHAEGVLAGAEEVVEASHVGDLPEESRGNVIDVRLRRVRGPESPAVPRLITSACGLCGSRTLENLSRRTPELSSGPRIEGRLLAGLPDRLEEAQAGFAVTGGLHGAALFDANGVLLAAREDVGRHNAVDKVIGWALAERRLPLSDAVLVVSGRAGFEIAQKAWCAGTPILVSVSAPSSLAVDLARRSGMTLVGFARKGNYNVYHGAERIVSAEAATETRSPRS